MLRKLLTWLSRRGLIKGPAAGGPPDPGDPDAEKPFVAHLEELRRVILLAAGCLAAGMALAIPLAPWILDVLKRPLESSAAQLAIPVRAIRAGTGLSLAMQIAFWGGLILSAPGVIAAIASFVFPGLTGRERKVTAGAILAASLLFVFGVVFCYLTTLKPAVVVLLQIDRWMGVEMEFIEITDYVGFALKVLLSFGLAFEVPVVVVALGAMGLVSYGFLRDKRRHAIVILMAAAMILTPTMDPVTMLLMGIPLVALYEACIWIVRAMERARGA